MTTDNRTVNRGYQLPAAGNSLAVDVNRLIASLTAVDSDIADIQANKAPLAMISPYGAGLMSSASAPAARVGLGLGDIATINSDATDHHVLFGDGSWADMAWAKLVGTPTTLAGYGISDVYRKDEVSGLFGRKTLIALATLIASTVVPSTTTIIETSGYNTPGVGKATYILDSTVDAAFAAANPLWAFVTSNGMGFRIVPVEGRLHINQFGADPATDRTASPAARSAAAAANYAAWLGMYNCAIYNRINSYGVPGDRTTIEYMALPSEELGYGTYWFGGNTLHVSEGQHRIFGCGAGSTSCMGAATQLQWDGTCDGMIFHEWKESSVPGRVSTYYPTSANSLVSGILFDGGGGLLSLTNAGVWCVSNGGRVENCGFVDWAQNGVTVGNKPTDTIMATGANLCFVRYCNFVRCGYAGLHYDGGDSNAGGSDGCSFIYCGYYGIADSSFLANSHRNHHVRGIGFSQAAGTSTQKVGDVAPCIVSYNGYYWHVMPGKAALASTTTPGNNNTIWRPFLAYSTVNLGYGPAWVSGATYHEGAAWFNDNPNAPSTFTDCYHEGDCPAPYHSPRGLTLQGLNAYSDGGGGANVSVVNGALTNRNGGLATSWRKYDPTVSGGTVPSDTLTLTLGNNPANGDLLSFTGTRFWPSTSRIRLSADERDLVGFDYANSASNSAWWFTGPNTTQTFGAAAVRPYHTYISKLIAGSTGRRIEIAAAAPSSGEWARGDVIFNSAPSAAGKIGWSCTTGGTAGSTAVFKPFGAIDA